MPRRLLNLLSALSLLLCAAVVAMWVRSHWVGDRLSRQADGRAHAVYSGRGGFGVSCLTNGQPPRGLRWQRVNAPDYPFTATSPPTPAERLGFQSYKGAVRFGGLDRPPMPFRNVVVPYWAVSVAAAAPSVAIMALTARRRRRERRLSGGLCPSCGYDLRASPNQCPECGSLR